LIIRDLLNCPYVEFAFGKGVTPRLLLRASFSLIAAGLSPDLMFMVAQLNRKRMTASLHSAGKRYSLVVE
jgi:hypothetical protein